MINFDTADWNYLISLIEQTTGLYYPENKWGELEKALSGPGRDNGEDQALGLIREFKNDAGNSETFRKLIEKLTVGETYFFREKPFLSAFTDFILPETGNENGNQNPSLDIWSAGCCTGEEPYTLAILLREHLTASDRWKITIRGTDINKNFIDRAREGKYPEWSFRETPAHIRTKYFHKEGKYSRINGNIAGMVGFSVLNLAGRDFQKAGFTTESVDVIFCRNVLMYFSAEATKNVLVDFFDILKPGGWLVLSSVEVPAMEPSPFAFVRVGDATLLRKVLPSFSGQSSGNRSNSGTQNDKPARSRSLLADKQAGKQKTTNNAKHPAVPVPGLSGKFFTKPDNRPVPSADRKNKNTVRELEIKKAFAENRFTDVIEMAGDIEVNEKNEELAFLVGRSLANNGSLDESLHVLEALQKLTPNKAVYFFLQAAILQERGQTDEAEVYLRRSLYLDPAFCPANLYMGNLMIQKGSIKQALTYYHHLFRILENEPDNNVMPFSGGMTVGYVRELIKPIIKQHADG